jgi:ribosomal protein L14
MKYDKCWTILKIKDNSGGIYCGCIKVLKTSSRRGALSGHVITVLLKKTFLKNTLLKKVKYFKRTSLQALVIRSATGLSVGAIFF